VLGGVDLPQRGEARWVQYLANQERLRENAQRSREQMDRRRGAPREGAALLQGLITCGLCGYQMHPEPAHVVGERAAEA
jgi:hypothetical protein